MGWGSPWLIAAVLGQWDWGPQIAPPPKRKEGKRGKSKARNSSTPCGRDTEEIRGGVLPCLCPFPLFSASSIPVSSEQGSWPSLYLVSFCLSSHLTYFPFGRRRRWRLISVTVTVAFPLDLVVLPRPTTSFNITSAFNRCISVSGSTLNSQLPPLECPNCLPSSTPAHTGVSSPQSPPLLLSHEPGVRRQMQIAEPNRPNGPHLKICRFDSRDSDRPQLHRFAGRSVCLVELSFRQHWWHTQEPEHRKGGQKRGICPSARYEAHLSGWMGRVHWRCDANARDATPAATKP